MLFLEEEEEEHNWVFSADQLEDEAAGIGSLKLYTYNSIYDTFTTHFTISQCNHATSLKLMLILQNYPPFYIKLENSCKRVVSWSFSFKLYL